VANTGEVTTISRDDFARITYADGDTMPHPIMSVGTVGTARCLNDQGSVFVTPK
jgi:hypothetical protein